jgi:uncharacterized protein (DUF2147 family)
MTRLFGFCLFLFLIIGPGESVIAQAHDPIERAWYTEDKTAKILIYRSKEGTFDGKVVWLKVPNRNGKPKIDELNPDPHKKGQPILGLVILEGFKKDGKDEYKGGTIYDPKSGKTYSCKMERDGNKLDVRGYIGISMFGKSTTFYSE